MTAPALVTVYHTNKSQRKFVHNEYTIEPGGSADVPQDVADRWCSHNHFGYPEVTTDAGKVTAKTAAIASENARLKEELGELTADAQAAVDRIAVLEKLLDEARRGSSGAPKIHEVADQAPGETAPSQETVAPAELPAARNSRKSKSIG